jgi:hypothetical protein
LKVAHELQGFARLEQAQEEFSLYSGDIVRKAKALGSYLSIESGATGEPGWAKADAYAVANMAELEYDLENLPIIADFDDGQRTGEQIDEFLGLRHAFYTALPFSEAERIWFLKTYRQGEPFSSPEDLPRFMGHYEQRIVSAGIRQLISGRELTRRWLAWHRETDEYAGQDTLDVATAALGGLARLFAVARPYAPTSSVGHTSA